ncbi:MAG: hypothetical protein AAGB93_09815 [Planctomycetota bacterium]
MHRSPPRVLAAALAVLILIGLTVVASIATDGAVPPRVTRLSPVAAGPADEVERPARVPLSSEPITDLASAAAGTERAVAADGRPSCLSVRVKLARRPVAGAIVRILDAGDATHAARTASTDAKGRWRVDLPPDRAVVVEVEAPEEQIVVRRDVVTAAAGTSKTVVFDLGRMSTARSLTFEIVSMPAGTPLRAHLSARSPVEGGERRRIGEGRADERGRIELLWDGPGSQYRAEAPGHSASTHTVQARAANEAPIRIELAENATVFGTLAPPRTARGERAARGRSIRIERAGPVEPDRSWDRRYPVQKGGRWWCEGLPLARAKDVHAGTRVVVTNGWTTRLVAADLTIRPGDDLQVSDVFEDAPGLTLEVRQRANARWTKRLPLAFVPSGARTYAPWLATFVEGSGEAEIDRLPEGRWDVYAGTLDERHMADPLATIDHDGLRGHTLVAAGFVAVQGKVVRADGTPVKYTALTLDDGTETRRGQTRSDGTFAFPIVEEGAACAIEVMQKSRSVPRKSSVARVEFIANGDSVTVQL